MVSETALAPIPCAVCPQFFTPRSDTARACSPRCAQRYVNAQKRAAAADRRATRERLIALRSRSDWLKIVQRTFNQWILLRDAGKRCVSCRRQHKGKMDAGHYIAAGDCEALRFHEPQVRAQCTPCNHKRHGALIGFRQQLVRELGADAVEALENQPDDKRHTIPELRAIRDRYRALIRAKIAQKGEGQ